MARKSTAVAAKGSTGIASMAELEDVLGKYAKETADAEKSGGSFISHRGGRFTFQGNPVRNNEMNVIVLDSIYENAYFGSKFDPDAIESPVCFAFGRGEDGTSDSMAPHEKSSDKQHDQCLGCPQNSFGTSERGKGKACGNRRRLALIVADGLDADNVDKAAVAYMKLPVTSVKGWGKYVKDVGNQLGRPYFTVATKLSITSDKKDQYHIVFEVGAVLNDAALVKKLIARHEKQKPETAFPYEPVTKVPKAAKPAKAAGKVKGRK